MDEKIDKKLDLKKHIALVHSSSKITLVQKKITNALLHNAYDELMDADVHKIEVSRLCKLIDFGSHNQQVVKDALKGLMQTIIEWNVIDEDIGQVWEASTLLASVSLKGSICEYSYSHHLKNLLYSPIRYGIVNLSVQAKFKSSYGLALYENCNRYRKIGQTPQFDILTFRSLMGISEEKYPIFRDFKRRVLSVAINEVNTYSDILIEPSYIKKGRRVVQIKFMIEPRRKMPVIGQKLKPTVSSQKLISPEEKVITHLVDEFKLKKKLSSELVAMYGLEKVNETIGYINKIQSDKERKPIKRPGLYLIKVLEQSENSTNQLKSNAVNKYSKAIIEEYSKYVRIKAFEAFLALPTDKQNELIDDFEQFMKNKLGVRYAVTLKNFTAEKIYSDNFIKSEFLEFMHRGDPTFGTGVSIVQYVDENLNSDIEI